ncbi:MAG: cytochrome c-type biogenesis protein [Candidatus Competibacteraceae bacterium]|jgi:cytochrome c-type biogenesis protein CcmH|nr:cytochrome c-type biogenesis protein [Candidatus Competibacteraceae bacterium]
MKIVLATLLMVLTGSVLAAINAYEFNDPAQEQRFRTLIAELRCPKCQNQNIADSNAPLSQDLRQRVFEMLQQGHSDTDIIAFMVARYGDFITYRPPLKPLTWLLWFGPFTLMAIVAGLLFVWLRRQRNRPTDLSEQEQARLNTLLADSNKDS